MGKEGLRGFCSLFCFFNFGMINHFSVLIRVCCVITDGIEKDVVFFYCVMFVLTVLSE
jgi:hypothetical protein